MSHFPVRRLEAEAIRDAILTSSGALDDTMYGTSVGGNTRRRSVYLEVRRNRLDPFLTAFDAPQPHTTLGHRPATNVPVQSLLLLNNRWVIEQAEQCAKRAWSRPDGSSDRQRVEFLYRVCFSRPPTEAEVDDCLAYLAARDGAALAAKTQANDLEEEIAALGEQLSAITQPMRERLLASRSASRVEREALRPIARWDFEADLSDSLGPLDGRAFGGAQIHNGALIVDGQGYVVTAKLDRPLTEKTLEVWVELSTLDQRGGGAMSIQTPDGAVFDSIVFAEKHPRQWLAGSDFFRRTQPFQAPSELAASQHPVHIAFCYDSDGTIRGYRDGQLYGTPYRSPGPVEFESGKAEVVFGMRHGPPGGNKMLFGRILHAQLYDRALSSDEVAVSGLSLGGYVPESRIEAELSKQQRAQYRRVQSALTALIQRHQESTATANSGADQRNRWRDLAHALWNLKEFIYVR
ncbi:MAG: DUF1553 domain-containing protein [Planctomycetales bacterium]|nr:DUF1553 domain-containing protein [Planctomycetales bacterium]